MNDLAQGKAHFITADVTACRKDPNSGACLQRLYQKMAEYGLQKIKLCEILVEHMMSPNSRRRIESRPIIEVLERVVRLAVGNPFPTMHEI